MRNLAALCLVPLLLGGCVTIGYQLPDGGKVIVAFDGKTTQDPE